MVCALQPLRAPPLKTEHLKPKTETVSTKLSELPQTTTYYNKTYKQLLGLARCIGPKPGNCIRPKSGTNQGLSLCIRPNSGNCIGPKSGTDWDLVPCIGPKSGTNCIGPKSGTDCIGPKSGTDRSWHSIKHNNYHNHIYCILHRNRVRNT